MIRKGMIGLLISLCLLTGCAANETGSGEELRSVITENELPASVGSLSQLIAENALPYSVDDKSTLSYAEGQQIHFIVTETNAQVTTVETCRNEAYGYHYVLLALLSPGGNIAGVKEDEVPAFFSLACDLYGEGFDSSALYNSFQNQLNSELLQNRPEEWKNVWLLERQGDVYFRFAVNYKGSEIDSQTVWIANQKAYEDLIKPKMEAYELAIADFQ